jgi:hypothetical protein
LRSSITDTVDFRSACAAAANNLASAFKQDPQIVRVVEHVDRSTGAAYLDAVRRQTPCLLDLLPRLTRADGIGGAITCDYAGFGALSPNTCRYLKVLSDVCLLFPDMAPDESVTIVEVGGGYGGQAFVLAEYFESLTYTIVDLPEVGALQTAYLQHLVPSLDFTIVTPDALLSLPPADLAISNYAISECRKDQARRYVDEILNHVTRGYVTCNFNDTHCPSRYEFEIWIDAPTTAYPEAPETWPGNYLLTWGSAVSSGFLPLPPADPADQPFDPRKMRD